MSNDNTENVSISQHGNVTRVTHGMPVASPIAAPREAARVYGGVTRFNMGQDSSLTHSGVTSYTVGQDRDTSSVAATFQRLNGVDTVELIPGNPASRTNIRQAIADGLIEPAGPGLWRDRVAVATKEGSASPAAKAPAAAPEKPPVDPGAGVFDPAEDAAWAEDIAPLPQHAYDAAAASVTTAILTGANNFDRAAQKLAEQAAIPLELAHQYVNEGYAMYERIVAKEVAAMGVDEAQRPAFYEWLRTSKSRSLQNAMQSLTAARDITPFRTLALEFKRRL